MNEDRYQSSGREVIAVARAAARCYVRRYRWADEADLTQEAASVVLTIIDRGTWSPLADVPFGAYAFRSCVRHLSRYLLRARSPVSETARHAHELVGARASSLTEYTDPLARNPAEHIDEVWWHSSVRAELAAVFARQGADAPLAARMLLDEVAPRVIAAEMGIPVMRAYRIAARARRLLASNTRLLALHHQRNEPS